MIISFAKPSVTIPPSLEWVGMGWLPPPLGSLNMDIDCPYFFLGCIDIKWASLVAQLVKNLGAMWETWVQSLDWEDPLEDGMATHSSMATHSNILSWRIPMDKGAWHATVHGVAKSWTD